FYALEREDFKERFLKEAKALGLSVAKFKQTENVVFAKISDGGVEVRLEINFARVRTPEEAVVGRFEKTDGSFLDIFVLPLEVLISEKMLAYENRRFVRDFYDVYHLSGLIEGQVRGLKEFLARAKPPVDEKNLETLVYSGVAPSFKRMTEVLTARAGKTS
ncbi:nucleotidyl transferase AbiEii/AbiGii toxin family protein, partial [Candidatus Micrarchaeota archaeon]|nr:nucleotidyl transferase AbiEii/AbiGii toxin family protein [Candidatus Micrarchaeota archaeon]